MAKKDYNKLSREEFEKILFKKFNIYRKHKLPPTQTTMCWGIDHGSGWYNLIWELSEEITKEVKKSKGWSQ